MFKNLLKPDNPLMITMTWIIDCIFLSLFWLLGCFPVITAGASFAALYDAAYRTYRKGEKHSWHRFAHVFRQNWKAGILPGLAVGAGFYGLLRVMIRVWNAAVAQEVSFGLFAGCAFLAVVVLGVISIALPQLSRFEVSFGTLLKNSLLLGIVNLPRTLALGVLNAIAIFLCIRFVFPVFFLPALAALIGSLFIEPMFKPYMPKEVPEEAAE